MFVLPAGTLLCFLACVGRPQQADWSSSDEVPHNWAAIHKLLFLKSTTQCHIIYKPRNMLLA